MTFRFFLLTAISLCTSCSFGPSEAELLEISREQRKNELKALSRVSALPLDVAHPVDNQPSPAKIRLGRLLFFDPILSGQKDIACASCHHPVNGFAEFRDISIGTNAQGFGSKRAFNENNTIPFLRRNAHTVLNAAYNGINYHRKYSPEEAPMFWDLRAQGLEAQALEPIKTFEEMRGEDYREDEILPEVIRRLEEIEEYRHLFAEAFGINKITSDHLAKAIATYERTLVTNNSRFDKYMRGDEEAISLSEKKGLELFKEVGCANCHNGPMFSDFEAHVLGVPDNDKLAEPDRGFDEKFAFRTASLRNLRFTAPYMHNGELKTLQKVLEFYEDISFGKSRNALVPIDSIDPLARDLTLRVRDMAPIISFLNTLNARDFDRTVPKQVPSGLSVGGEIDLPPHVISTK